MTSAGGTANPIKKAGNCDKFLRRFIYHEKERFYPD
jgi:hypothetical protein